MSTKSLQDLQEFVGLYRQMDDIAAAIESRKVSLRDAKEAIYKLRWFKPDNIVVKTVVAFIQYLESEIKDLQEYAVYICDSSFCKGIAEEIPIQHRYDAALTFIAEEYATGNHDTVTSAVQVWEKALASPKIDANTIKQISNSKAAAQLREDIIVPLRKDRGDPDIEEYEFVHSKQDTTEEVTEEKISIKKLLNQDRYLTHK